MIELPMDVIAIPLTNSEKVTLVDAADIPLIRDFKWYLSHDGYAASEFHTPQVNHKRLQIPLRMHRLLLWIPRHDRREGDHINHDPLDNRRSNLRIATRAQNRFNIRKSPKQMRHRFKGVRPVYSPASHKLISMWKPHASHIRSLRQQGFTFEQIGEHYNLSKSRMKEIAVVLGVHVPKRARRRTIGPPKIWLASIGFNRKLIHIGNFSFEEEAAMAYNVVARRLYGEFAHLNKVEMG